jgi:hypothetical protein
MSDIWEILSSWRKTRLKNWKVIIRKQWDETASHNGLSVTGREEWDRQNDDGGNKTVLTDITYVIAYQYTVRDCVDIGLRNNVLQF